MPRDRRFGNRVLDMLPDQDLDLFADRLETVRIPLTETIHRIGEPVRHVHFPVSCVLSSVIVLQDGATIEAETIGKEGVCGYRLVLDEDASPYLVTQQLEGESLRIPVGPFREALDRSRTLRHFLARYAAVLLRQAAQNAACNVHHVIEERMCRWLLECSHRIGSDQIRITQEFLGSMLGVRRQSVNMTAGRLQESGLIAYRRGNVTILDHERLENSACECFQINREAYDQRMR